MTSQATNQIVMIVGRNILRARLEKGLTQREVGVALQMDGRGVSRWENGRVLPGRRKLAELADFFGCDQGWFFVEHDDDQVAA